MDIAGILLAAGAGTRFGGGKLLHRLPDGTPIGLASYARLAVAFRRVVVVVRAGDAAVRDMFRAAGAEVVECARAHLGMGHSVASGIEATGDAGAWIIALGDMPAVRSDTFEALAATLAHGAAIVAPRCQGQRGNPVGFAGEYREALLALTGDTGARDILQRDRARVVLVDVDDPGVLADVDRPADVAALPLAAGAGPAGKPL